MFWWFLFFSSRNSSEQGRPAFSTKQKLYVDLSLCLSCLFLLVIIVCAMVYFIVPHTGDYDGFHDAGTVDCYISTVSDSDGYVVNLISKEGTLFSTPISKERYQELAYIKEQETDPVCYRMEIFETDNGNYFVSTYEDPSRREAWEDYRSALFVNTFKRDLGGIIVGGVFILLLLAFEIFFLIRTIRGFRYTRPENQIVVPPEGNGYSPSPRPEPAEEPQEDTRFDDIDPSNMSWHK